MDKRNIKRIIAREGLLSLGLICGILLLFISKYYYVQMEKILKVFSNTNWSGWGVSYVENETSYNICRYSGFFLIICYFCILLIRFIIWAIRTLKEK